MSTISIRSIISNQINEYQHEYKYNKIHSESHKFNQLLTILK